MSDEALQDDSVRNPGVGDASSQNRRLIACWRLLGAACRDTRLSRSNLAVLQSVLDRIGKTGTAWPSLSTIAVDARVDRTTASRSIAELVTLGYLERESGDRCRANTYRLGRAPLDDGASSGEPATSGEAAPSGQGTTTEAAQAAAGSGEPATTGSGELATEVVAGPPLQPAPRTYPRSKAESQASLASLALVSDDDSTSESRPPKQRKRPGNAAEPEGWAEFWEVYPRKVSRPAALKAWRKLAPDAVLRATIMRGLAAQLPALLASEPRYRPHPATWLNGERWTDEPLDADRGTQSGATERGILAVQRMKGAGNVAQDFDAVWAQQPRPQAGMLPRDPRSEEEQLEAMIAGSIDPEATRALLRAAIEEEQAG